MQTQSVAAPSQPSAAFNAARSAQRFYTRFAAERSALLAHLTGIPDEALRQRYALVMLNRVLLLYFMQQQGFLDNDTAYLRSKLAQSRLLGQDRFYADYFCRLCCEGLAQRPAARTAAVHRLLGAMPYLGSQLFARHQIEQIYGCHLQIPDSAFERLFDCFDQYRWSLDEGAICTETVITPAVLGFINEKDTNQKTMGVYYTQADITGYISQHSIIPYLLEAVYGEGADHDCSQAIGHILQVDPDRYIHPVLKWGVDLPLPPAIAAGLDDPPQRAEWNAPAPEAYALPTESWREVVARRTRYSEVKAGLVAAVGVDGCAPLSIADCITYNLNVLRLACDLIATGEDPTRLHAFYRALEQTTILDPTCGSGAFLLAALETLEPLYAACLSRMQQLVEEGDSSQATAGEQVQRVSDFHTVLDRVAQHPDRRYFILKSIIVNNLYGVDIAEEAIAMCQTRLWLKLLAQVEHIGEIEPLPAIDRNIRAGNALVGYVDAAALDLVLNNGAPDQGGGTSAPGLATPQELEDYLNRCLAREYGLDGAFNGQGSAYEQWLATHQPLHWCAAFDRILKRGGFDVIIGNPPYVEYRTTTTNYTVRGYQTEPCGNLYAFVIERCLGLLRDRGRMGLIVPHAAICTDRMALVQALFSTLMRAGWFSTYAIRPAKLFAGVDQRLTICLAQRGIATKPTFYAARYHRWHEAFRPYLLALLQYAQLSALPLPNSIPKIHHAIESTLLEKLAYFSPLHRQLTPQPSSHALYFHNAPRYWIRVMDFAPYFWNEREGAHLSTQVKRLHLPSRQAAAVVAAALNSSLFYWWFIVLSDCRHLNLREIEHFPIGLERMSAALQQRLTELCEAFMHDLRRHARRKECVYQATGRVVYDEFYPKYSKPLLDAIDRVLAQHYGFTEAELDYIINYDIKYRMGGSA